MCLLVLVELAFVIQPVRVVLLPVPLRPCMVVASMVLAVLVGRGLENEKEGGGSGTMNREREREGERGREGERERQRDMYNRGQCLVVRTTRGESLLGGIAGLFWREAVSAEASNCNRIRDEIAAIPRGLKSPEWSFRDLRCGYGYCESSGASWSIRDRRGRRDRWG